MKQGKGDEDVGELAAYNAQILKQNAFNYAPKC